jgi:Gon7 family
MPAQSQVLSAVYSAPLADSENFSHELPTMPLQPQPSTEERCDFLASLRAKSQQLQGQINVFLTAKMEEDKAKLTSQPKATNEDNEEENYGEETVE